MAIVNWPTSTYPAGLDTFTSIPQVDGVTEVMSSHPNSLASAVEAIEAKLGITGDVATGFGGLSFEGSGKAANPGGIGEPTLWVDNTSPNFVLTYTDELGVDHPIAYTSSTYWQRIGTTLSPLTAGDTLNIAATSADVTLDSDTGLGLSTSGSTADIELSSYRNIVNTYDADGNSTGTFSVIMNATTLLDFTNSGAMRFSPASNQDLTITTDGTGDVDLFSDESILHNYDVDDGGTGTFSVVFGTGSPTTLIEGTSVGALNLESATNQAITLTTDGTGDIDLLSDESILHNYDVDGGGTGTFTVVMNATTLLTMGSSGSVAYTPASNQSFSVTTDGTGDIDLLSDENILNRYDADDGGTGTFSVIFGTGSPTTLIEGTSAGALNLEAATGQNVTLTTDGAGDVEIYSDDAILQNYDVGGSGSGTFSVVMNATTLLNMDNVGGVDFTPASGQDLTITTAGGGGVSLHADGNVLDISDSYRGASGYTNPMQFSGATTDWDDFVSYFGDGTSLLAALNYTFLNGGSSLGGSGGDDMYSSTRGDFAATYSSGTEVVLTGLPFNISASNIMAVIRKPTGTAVSVQRTRGVDLDCSWTPDASIEGKGTVTLSSSFFSASDEIDVIIEGKPKAYDPMNNAQRSMVINPDSLRYEVDNDISYSSLTGPGTKVIYYSMSSEGYHRLSMVVYTLSDATVKIYGTNSPVNYIDDDNYEDITLLALGTQQVTTTGSYECLDSISYNKIYVEIDYADATGTGAVGLAITRSAV